MSTIQANLSPAQARARELKAALPQNADAEGRIAASRAAVDTLEREFPGSPEAACLKLVRAQAQATERGVTRETLLNAGMDLCVKGAAAGSSYLAGTALQLSAMGWDESDKNRLLDAGYLHLRQGGILPEAPEMLRLAEKYGDLRHRRNILEDAAAGTPDAPGLAAKLVAHSTDRWEDLASGLLDHLAASGPQELRGAYGLGRSIIGTWFSKLGGSARNRIFEAFLGEALRKPEDTASRVARAVKPPADADWNYYGDADLVQAAQRALDALAPGAAERDRLAASMARQLIAVPVDSERRPWKQRVLAAGLERLGGSGDVSGTFVAGLSHGLVAAAGVEANRAQPLLEKACTLSAEASTDGRWRAAFKDLARLLPHLRTSYYDESAMKGFLAATEAMARLGSGGDPVEAMVGGVSSVAHGGDPASVIGDFLGGKDTGELRNTPIVRELLAVLAEDGSTPQMRATARFVHRAMESGDLKEGMKSMKDAFEIARMAQATEDPNAIRLGEDQVQIGGVVIRRRGEPAQS